MMPPRNNGQSSFAVDSAATAEVACPLNNQDGTTCRKRCLGEKRYRSMQEHIRRAHPEYYIPKLPATKESFEQMVTSAPHEVPLPPDNPRPHSSHHPHHNQQQQHHLQHAHPSGLSSLALNIDNFGSSFEGGYNALDQHDGGYYTASDTALYNNMQMHQPRSPYEEYRRGSIIGTQTAAAVLAGLHNSRPDSEFEGDFAGQSYHADNEFKSSHFVDPTLDEQDFLQDHEFPPPPPPSDPQPHNLPLNDFVRSSSPPRPSTMASMHRSLSRGGFTNNRPRKSSLSHSARLPKHERKKSKELKRRSGEKLLDHRWQDLVDAAASATEEEGSRDLTPVPGSPYQSPHIASRTPLPPFGLGAQFHQSFQASPLTRALTPPPAPQDQTGLDLQTFPSVESSISNSLSHHHNTSTDSGSQFQIMHPQSLDSNSSPMFTPASRQEGRSLDSTTPQIYCDGCSKPFLLTECRACTSCIRGFCDECQSAILTDRVPGRPNVPICPKCQIADPSFKPFQLTFR